MSALAAFATVVVNLLTSLLPALPGSAVIDNVIETLVQILPIVVKEATQLLAPIQNIITTLKSSGTVTTAQFEALEALQRQADGDFETAAVADGAPVDTDFPAASEPAASEPTPTQEESANSAGS